MKVIIDAVKCQGHARCLALAPELFDTDDLGYGFVIADGEVLGDQERNARRAVSNCPEHAIDIVE